MSSSVFLDKKRTGAPIAQSAIENQYHTNSKIEKQQYCTENHLIEDSK